MNKIAAYYSLLEDHYLWNKEAMSAEERNAIIDEAKSRANLGALARTSAGLVSGGLAEFVPLSTLAAGSGVEDRDLRSDIQARTLAGGTLGKVTGALPGTIYGGIQRARGNAGGALLGVGGALLGGLAGELAGQRIGLNRLKQEE